MGYQFGKYWFLEDEERLRIYRETAAHGDLTSIKELAYILRTEGRTPQDLSESFKWSLRAASFNDIESLLVVGDMFRQGVGTDKAPVKAIEYYKKVVRHHRSNNTNVKAAVNKIAYAFEHDLNDGKQAIKWLIKSVRLGDNNAKLRIAKIYCNGNGINPSGEKAIEWFTKILNDKSLPKCERNSVAFEIAEIFYEGKIIQRNEQEAIKYFKIATKAEVVVARAACNKLVQIYSTSEDTTPNIGMTIHWLKKAAELGSRRATLTIAKIFRDGKFGVNQNGEKALEILRDSAEQNFDTISKVSAMRMIAEMYNKGLAIPEDKQKAAELYQASNLISSKWIQSINNMQLQV